MSGRLSQMVSSPRWPAGVSLFVLVALIDRIPHEHPLDPNGVAGQFAIVVALAGLAIRRPRERHLRVLTAVATIASVASLTISGIVVGKSSSAFSSCITILMDESSTSAVRPCERSYENPLSASQTRTDQAIDFGFGRDLPESIGETNWDISALNSSRYNFYPESDKPSRGRVPFKVRWSGIPEVDGSLVVRYVGEGQVSIGGAVTDLPATYESAGEVAIASVQGSELHIDFTWDPLDRRAGPFAAFVLLDSNGEVVSARASRIATVLVAASLALLIVTLLALAALVIGVLFRARPERPVSWWFWLSTSFLLVTLVAALSQAPGPSRSIWELPIAPVAMFLLLVLFATHFPQDPSRVVAWSLIAVVSFTYVQKSWTFLGDVVYRSAGDDFLTYESFAREILETGSLRGGEDVFVYSPAIRYWLYLQHLLFGDSDRLIFALSLLVLMGAAWFAIRILIVDRTREPQKIDLSWRGPAVIAMLAAVTLFSALIGYRVVWTGGAVLLSEYPTWPLLIVALALTLRGWLSDRTLVLIGALLGLALLFRFNQVTGIVAILITAILLAARHRFGSAKPRFLVRVALPITLPLLTLSALPLIHNLAYGRRWIPFQTSVSSSFPLSPQHLLEWNSESTVWQTLMSQVGGVLVFNDQISLLSPISLIARVIQVVGVVLLAVGALHRFKGVWSNTLWFGIPLSFLLPHIFIQVFVYYPRHVIAGYMTAAVVIIGLTGCFLMSRRSWSWKRNVLPDNA